MNVILFLSEVNFFKVKHLIHVWRFGVRMNMVLKFLKHLFYNLARFNKQTIYNFLTIVWL